MPRVFVRTTKGEPERREVVVSEVEGMAVEELRHTVSRLFSVPLDTLNLIYGGRLLRAGKHLGHYNVVDGSTLHLISKRPWNLPDEEAIEARQRAKLGTLLGDRRILRALGRMMSDPLVVQSIMEIPTLRNNSVVIDALQNPQLFNNPNAIAQFLESNPEVAFTMDSILRQRASGEGGGEGGGGEEGSSMVDVVEGQLEEDARQAQEMTLQMNRVQMFEHSQALQAHEQQARSQRQAQEPQQESSRQHNPSTSRQHGTIESGGGGGGRRSGGGGGGGRGGRTFTQNQLSAALAGAVSAASSPQPSPLSSLNFPNVGSSSAPASLTVESQPQQQQQQQHEESTASVVPVQASGQQQDSSQMAGTVGREELATAVQQAFRRSASTPQEAELPPHMRYMAHLEQLHMMGITDDAACLHALEATGGDLQAALEILYSR